MTGRTFPAGMAKKGAKPPVGTKGAADWYWKRYTELYPKYFWADDTKLADIVVASAKGSLLHDVEGREYIDLTSQWATNNLGNVHPEILKATVDALERYGFLILFMNPHLPMIDVAERLLSIRPSKNLTRVFLELSGTGAAEGAVKHAIEASGRPLILSFMGQYHGLSIGATAFGSWRMRTTGFSSRTRSRRASVGPERCGGSSTSGSRRTWSRSGRRSGVASCPSGRSLETNGRWGPML